MDLNLNSITEKLDRNEFVQNFIEELSKALQNYDKKSAINLEDKNMDNIKLTDNEELEFERKKFNFLQNYFKKELSDLSKGEIYIVTNKYENDDKYNRYKVTQYKDNLECKYITFKEDLPSNVQLGDVVRKINGKYIYDDQATKYVKDNLSRIKQDIVNSKI